MFTRCAFFSFLLSASGNLAILYVIFLGDTFMVVADIANHTDEFLVYFALYWLESFGLLMLYYTDIILEKLKVGSP